jgi:hypothetical protein
VSIKKPHNHELLADSGQKAALAAKPNRYQKEHHMEFKDKFIGFIDILGFKNMVEVAEAGTGMALKELLEALKHLGEPEDKEKFKKYGPTTCPQSQYLQRDLDFQLKQISDCVIVSSEVSPAGVINLVQHCWGAVIMLLTKGFMCRGYITRGLIYHTEDQVIGSGYQKAYGKESHVTAFKRSADERGTPFVEVDQVICDYIATYTDSCVKKMFSRYVKTDGEVTALFPFQRLSHSFVIGGFGLPPFDPEKERRSNHNVRIMLQNCKEQVVALVDKSNPNAMIKAEHYLAALDAQLEVCLKTDKFIAML